jgi:hypothetical protein
MTIPDAFPSHPTATTTHATTRFRSTTASETNTYPFLCPFPTSLATVDTDSTRYATPHPQTWLPFQESSSTWNDPTPISSITSPHSAPRHGSSPCSYTDRTIRCTSELACSQHPSRIHRHRENFHYFVFTDCIDSRAIAKTRRQPKTRTYSIHCSATYAVSATSFAFPKTCPDPRCV